MFYDKKVEKPSETFLQKKEEEIYAYHIINLMSIFKGKYRINRKICVGKMIDDCFMHPNNNYYKYYDFQLIDYENSNGHKSNISMKNKFIFIIMMGVMALPLLFYHFNIHNIFYHTKETSLSTDDAMTSNIEELDGGEYLSINNDPGLIFYDIKQDVQNLYIDIQVKGSSQNYNSQIFFDFGDGFSEENSMLYDLKNGSNLIKFNKIHYLNSLRIDPFDKGEIEFLINEIILNKKEFKYEALYILPIFFAFLFLKFLRTNSCDKKELTIDLILMYQCFAFLYYCSHMYMNIIVIALTLFMILFIENLWNKGDELC